MYTIKDLLSSGLLFDYKIMSGESVLEQRKIEYITVQEADLEDFIRENELVLSTGADCFNNTKKLIGFINEVYSSGAAGLILSIKTNKYALPKEAQAFAESHLFPIIMIPWECRFAEIIEFVLDNIKNQELMKVRFYENIQRNLLFEYLSSKDLSSALNILSSNLKSYIMVTDENSNLKSVSRNLEERDLSFMGEAKTVIHIQSNDRLYGFLYIAPYNTNSNMEEDKKYLEKYVVTPFTLWFNKEDIINETKLKLKNDFIVNLAFGNFPSEETAIINGKKNGFNIQLPYICVTGRIYSLIDGVPVNADMDVNSSQIETKILNISEKINKKIMCAIHENLIIIYIENKESDTLKTIYSFINRLETNLSKSFPDYVYYWGISEIKNSKTDFHKYFLNAKLALDLCFSSASKNNIGTYQNTSIYQILTVLTDHKEIQEITFSILKPLIEIDKIKQLCLCETLVKYIQNNYSVSRTARELHIHRQSLLYRIQKIENLINMSLDEHDNLFLLEICTRMLIKYQIENKN